MSDSEYEYEEETTYVTFDLGKAVSLESIQEVTHTIGGCRITGLEEGHPFLQLGEMVFEGTVDETIGTQLLFEMEDKGVDSRNILSSITPTKVSGEIKELPKTLKYEGSTETVVTLESITLAAKSTGLEYDQDSNENDDSSILSALC